MKAWKPRAARALIAAMVAAPALAAPPPAATPAPAKPLAPAIAKPATPAVIRPAATATATPAAPAIPTGPVGKLEIKETIFDAGTVERGTDISHAFELRNIGKGDLTVDAKPG